MRSIALALGLLFTLALPAVAQVGMLEGSIGYEYRPAKAPENNQMQQTRSDHSRWRPSLLIWVFYGPSAEPATRPTRRVCIRREGTP